MEQSIFDPAAIHIPMGKLKKTNRGSENDSISEKFLRIFGIFEREPVDN
jgi:hypothetical protein